MATGANPGSATGGGFGVTTGSVNDMAAVTRQTADEVQNDLNEMRAYVTDIETVWRGVAGNTFQALMHDFDVYAGMLNQTLTDIASGLEGNYVNYTLAEEQQIKDLQKVNGVIPGGNFS